MLDDQPVVKGPNFEAKFRDGHWEATWNWQEEPELSRRVGQHAMSADLRAEFDKGVGKWIENGWLRERQRPGGEPSVPLMAVLQETKKKVRPVLDYRGVNEYVSASSAKADVCAEKNARVEDVSGEQLHCRYT